MRNKRKNSGNDEKINKGGIREREKTCTNTEREEENEEEKREREKKTDNNVDRQMDEREK